MSDRRVRQPSGCGAGREWMGLSGESCSSHYIKEGGYVTAVGLFRGGTWAELNASRCVKRERDRRKRPVAYVYAHMKEMKGGAGGKGSLPRVQSNAEPEAWKARCSLGQPRYPNSTRPRPFNSRALRQTVTHPLPNSNISFSPTEWLTAAMFMVHYVRSGIVWWALLLPE